VIDLEWVKGQSERRHFLRSFQYAAARIDSGLRRYRHYKGFYTLNMLIMQLDTFGGFRLPGPANLEREKVSST